MREAGSRRGRCRRINGKGFAIGRRDIPRRISGGNQWRVAAIRKIGASQRDAPSRASHRRCIGDAVNRDGDRGAGLRGASQCRSLVVGEVVCLTATRVVDRIRW